MPKSRSPNREKAFNIYKEHGGSIENRRIAEMLQISEKTVGGWKCKDAWGSKLNGVLQTPKRSTPKEKGGQPGNKNATGPPGNKNAVKTGEFETLFFDCLNPDERLLAQMVPTDKEQLLLQEIQLLTVRERRMLKRIKDLQAVAEKQEQDKAAGMTAVKYKTGTEKDKETDLVEYTGVLGQIQSVEDALTRVQGKKQHAIDSLHRYGYDDAKLKLEIQKYQIGPPDETEDDGFLESLAGTAVEDWSDETGDIQV